MIKICTDRFVFSFARLKMQGVHFGMKHIRLFHFDIKRKKEASIRFCYINSIPNHQIHISSSTQGKLGVS